MKSYIYPAIFIKDQKEDMYRVIFPDLDLSTSGTIIEEAYLYAKECLKSYFKYVEKYDIDFNLPTDFETIKSVSEKDDIVMLVDATLSAKEIES